MSNRQGGRMMRTLLLVCVLALPAHGATNYYPRLSVLTDTNYVFIGGFEKIFTSNSAALHGALVGGGVSNLNASLVATGTLAAARLPANVPLLDRTNTWSGASNIYSGAFWLTSLEASQYLMLDANKKLASTLDGASWTNLNADQLLSGTIPSARIGSDIARTNTTILYAPTMTNGVNYGTAFSSPGTGLGAEEFGAAAVASGLSALAVGYGAIASGISSTAVGAESVGSGTNSLALGAAAYAYGLSSVALGAGAFASAPASVAVGAGEATGVNSLALGAGAEASAADSIALGIEATASHTNAIAIGNDAGTTGPNQVMLGAPGLSTVVQNNLTVGTNLTVGGAVAFGGNLTISGSLSAGGATFSGALTNLTVSGPVQFPAGSDVAFGRYALSGLANGGNAGVAVGTNTFVQVSGPSAAFSIDGIANGRNGKLLVLLNRSGQNMTIANESGVDPTAGNRILTLSGGDEPTTADGAAVLIYSAADSRWILVSLKP